LTPLITLNSIKCVTSLCHQNFPLGGQETMGVVGIVRVVVEYFEVVEVCQGL
ncbi:uncharacterized protein METZ01_LOCUS446693, partial [marine metagenome]